MVAAEGREPDQWRGSATAGPPVLRSEARKGGAEPPKKNGCGNLTSKNGDLKNGGLM